MTKGFSNLNKFVITINFLTLFQMVSLIQRENHAANKGKMAGRYQFDTHPTRIGSINYPM